MEAYRKPRVLVTFVEAGMGHIVSAQAISECLKKKYSDKMEIIESHILRDSDNPVLPKYEEFLVRNPQWYSRLPAYGDIQFASMHILGAQNTLKLIHNTIFYSQTKATIEEYTKYSPDVIVCTHYFLLYCAVEYKRKYNTNVIIVAYCPDNNVHGWWDNRADVLYTNNPLATTQAYELRFKNGHVVETFYPTRTDVTESNENKEFYRNKFGIPQDKFAVVIADGVYAKAKVKKVCNELLKTDYPLTICVLAGKNDKIKRYFDAKAGSVKPNITLLTFGFIKEAPQLYGACDLFITKGGPNAVLDSVMMGTPIIIDYCAHRTGHAGALHRAVFLRLPFRKPPPHPQTSGETHRTARAHRGHPRHALLLRQIQERGRGDRRRHRRDPLEQARAHGTHPPQ